MNACPLFVRVVLSIELRRWIPHYEIQEMILNYLEEEDHEEEETKFEHDAPRLCPRLL